MVSVPEATPSVPKSVVLNEARSCSWGTNYADSKTPVRRLATVLVAQATQVEQPRPVLVHVHPPVQSTSVYAGPNLPVNCRLTQLVDRSVSHPRRTEARDDRSSTD